MVRNMADTILKDAEQVVPYIEQVCELADAHRGEFGFLPKRAYFDAAMRGNLWVAIDVESSDLQGYLLFGGRHPQLRVFQICVHPSFRSSGIGRAIIEELKSFAKSLSCLRITARVLPKLEANKFWSTSGFRVVKQFVDPQSRSTLNIYAFYVDVPSLFGTNDHAQTFSSIPTMQIDLRRPLLPTHSYVIDLNVFFDAVRDRDAGQSAQILSFALNHDIHLVVTHEFVNELERSSQDPRNDPLLAFARNLPRLPTIGQDRLKPLIADLRDLLTSIPPGPRTWTANDDSDHTHIASSIHHRAYGFITRDSGILRGATRIEEKYGLRVVSPTDVVEYIRMDDRSTDVAMSITAENREIQVSTIHSGNLDNVVRFLGQRNRVEEYDLASRLGVGLGHSNNRTVVVSSSDQIVGVGLWSGISGGVSQGTYLLVDEDDADADRAIDHILVATERTTDKCRLSRLHVKIPREQIRTIETALKRGFHYCRDENSESYIEMIRVSISGVVNQSNWRRISQGFFGEISLHLPLAMPSYQELVNTGVVLGRDKGLEPSTMSLFDFETFIAPGVLLASCRGAVIIPIKRAYAEELLPEFRDQGLLLSQHDAAFRLERAYFLRARRHTLLPRGTIVVFYVSSPRSEAVGLARVTFSETLTTTQAVLNLSRQGVLTEEEIRRHADDNDELTVFTFDNALKFPQSIDIKELKKMRCISDANLVTAERISYDALARIVRNGFNRDV